MRQCKQAKYGERYGAAAGSFTACRCDCGHVAHACLDARAPITQCSAVQHKHPHDKTSVCSLRVCFCCCVEPKLTQKRLSRFYSDLHENMHVRPFSQTSTNLFYTK